MEAGGRRGLFVLHLAIMALNLVEQSHQFTTQSLPFTRIGIACRVGIVRKSVGARHIRSFVTIDGPLAIQHEGITLTLGKTW